MRRLRLIFTVAFVCVAGAIFVPGAAAGNFDEGKMGCSGETSPPVHRDSRPAYLAIPHARRGRGGDFGAPVRGPSAFPPGLSISDEGIISGRRSGGSYDLSHSHYTSRTLQERSDDRFIININRRSRG
jgi:hypothetical protein